MRDRQWVALSLNQAIPRVVRLAKPFDFERLNRSGVTRFSPNQPSTSVSTRRFRPPRVTNREGGRQRKETLFNTRLRSVAS